MAHTLEKMTAIRVGGEQYERLQEIGEQEDRPVSWLIRKAIDEYLERRPAKKKSAK